MKENNIKEIDEEYLLSHECREISAQALAELERNGTALFLDGNRIHRVTPAICSKSFFGQDIARTVVGVCEDGTIVLARPY